MEVGEVGVVLMVLEYEEQVYKDKDYLQHNPLCQEPMLVLVLAVLLQVVGLF